MSDHDGTESGSLLIADSSGYTEFLTGSELAHAQGIIDGLIGSILTSIQPAFELANLEGDAVFACAPATTLPPGPTTLDVIDSAYAAFIGTREHIQRNTNCPCQACSNIAALDLKFVAHFGSYVRSRHGAREELTGPDVVLVHRLLKNSIIETTQTEAYAFVTDTCPAASSICVGRSRADLAMKSMCGRSRLGSKPAAKRRCRSSAHGSMSRTRTCGGSGWSPTRSRRTARRVGGAE